MAKLNTTSENNTKVINKLILVGNGFDLALGIKTKYEDFLLWYFKNFIIKSLESKQGKWDTDGNLRHCYNEDDLFLFFNKTNYFYEEKEISVFNVGMDTFDKIKEFIKKSPQKFSFQFKSKLLEKIFKDSITGWVDIEKAYFDLLKENLNKSNYDIDSLNEELKKLKELLYEYLNLLDYSKSKDDTIAMKYNEQFAQDISWEEILEPYDNYKKYRDLKTGYLFFLNFNYTNSLNNVVEKLPDYFLSKNKKWDITNTHIHGDLTKDPDTIIFGYGDEMDKEYKKIEDLNDNRYFNNIKSFKYLESHSYRELIRYINYNDFQVVIYGHSCGLSDRIMLNEIFEHQNCKSIKIYYYNKREFINKTMDISRHFNSNQLMRKKIVVFNENDKIPQIK